MSVKPRSILIYGLLAATTTLQAEVAQPKLSKYTDLWTNSRMTVPPPPPDRAPGPNPLENYALLSVSPLGDGYMVTMRDTKDPKGGKVRLIPGSESNSGFKLISVEQDSSDYMNTRVKLAYNGREGYVGYNEKHLALKKPAAPPKAAQKPTPQPNRGQAANAAARQQNNADLNKILQQAAGTTGNQPRSRTPRARRVPSPPSR